AAAGAALERAQASTAAATIETACWLGRTPDLRDTVPPTRSRNQYVNPESNVSPTIGEGAHESKARFAARIIPGGGATAPSSLISKGSSKLRTAPRSS